MRSARGGPKPTGQEPRATRRRVGRKKAPRAQKAESEDGLMADAGLGLAHRTHGQILQEGPERAEGESRAVGVSDWGGVIGCEARTMAVVVQAKRACAQMKNAGVLHHEQCVLRLD